jgi:hypothetical protein
VFILEHLRHKLVGKYFFPFPISAMFRNLLAGKIPPAKYSSKSLHTSLSMCSVIITNRSPESASSLPVLKHQPAVLGYKS